MLCDKCCDSSNIKKLIEANGTKLDKKTTCPRCSRIASWSISGEQFIDALARIVENLYTPAEGSIDYFSSLDKEKAEIYRNAWNEYESIEYKPQETLPEDEEELDDDVSFERMMEESNNNEAYIAEKYCLDFGDLYQEYFNGSKSYHPAYNIFHTILNPSPLCRPTIDTFIPKLNYEESRFFYALHNPEEKIYWVDRSKHILGKSSIGFWDEYVSIIRTENRFFIEQNEKAKQILNIFSEIIKGSINLYYNGQIVYRARIASDDTTIAIESNPAQQLNNAPVDFTTYNRFSPAGISYAYASFDEQTAIEEIRPNNTDIVYIGTYQLEDKKYIDFSSSMLEKYCDIYDPFYKKIIADNKEFVLNFIDNIRKPISNDHQKIDYVPTQILSEYIKLNGYHGIIFDSSLTGKKNIVYFGAFSQYKSYKKVQIKLLTTYMECQ